MLQTPAEAQSELKQLSFFGRSCPKASLPEQGGEEGQTPLRLNARIGRNIEHHHAEALLQSSSKTQQEAHLLPAGVSCG
ncbi:hypothetical protein [Bradyrhizobium yuanmingense]|uniref:hypothetical protein n=1 Tax=Bradyrhizobium yuanmingense TaxID=108015 RepID=UPI0023B90537|nr:hypothetical protein [Bradyrhizobium yuanmingense]MDF0578905.1 hypothetical protein [Bradyrhizobium yuanmingense]